MFNYLTRKRKAQVTVYIFSAIATLIIVSFVIINIGKTAKDKTHADNAADAGALAACATMATGFNYVADDNSKQKEGGIRHDADEVTGKQPTSVNEDFSEGMTENYTEAENNQVQSSNLGSPPGQIGEQTTVQQVAQKKLTVNNDNRENQNKTSEKELQKKVNDAMSTMDDADNPAGQDYQNEAISMGYKICFQNSGTHHRLGKINSKRYEAFQKQLEPGMVQSGMPMTFFWVDGAARAHMVTCIINVESADSASENTAEDNNSTRGQKSEQENSQIQSMDSSSQSAQGGFVMALNPCLYLIGEGIGIAANGVAKVFRGGGKSSNDSLSQGQRNTKTIQKRGRASDSNEMPKNINDINNSRTVSAANFQFHMGSPIKSINADIDMVTFYPPVQSTAMATFNYTGSGRISDGSEEGGGQSARHECGLIGAF